MSNFPTVLLAVDVQTEFLHVLNFTILPYSQNSGKFHACKNKMVVYSSPNLTRGSDEGSKVYETFEDWQNLQT